MSGNIAFTPKNLPRPATSGSSAARTLDAAVDQQSSSAPGYETLGAQSQEKDLSGGERDNHGSLPFPISIQHTIKQSAQTVLYWRVQVLGTNDRVCGQKQAASIRHKYAEGIETQYLASLQE